MNNRKPIETEEELQNALEAFFCDVPEDEPIETINFELQSMGFDPYKVARRIRDVVQEMMSNSPLNWRNKAQEIQAARADLDRVRADQTRNLSRQEVLDSIQQLLRRIGRQDPNLLPVLNRNFEEFTDNDLNSMLDQLEHLASQKGFTDNP